MLFFEDDDDDDDAGVGYISGSDQMPFCCTANQHQSTDDQKITHLPQPFPILWLTPAEGRDASSVTIYTTDAPPFMPVAQHQQPWS